MTELTQTRYAYGKALLEVGEIYPEVAVLDADLYNSTRTVLFRDAFPDRFIDIGIAEADMVSTAAGMAASGLIPYANSFAIFLTAHCYDQIRIQIAYPSLHVILAGSSAGLTQGPDGASHQSLEDVTLMRALPHMRVLVPADSIETRAMTIAAARDIDGPVYIRLGRYPVPDVLDGDYSFELGRGTILRQGEEVALVACGHMVNVALGAAELLASRQISAAVINMSTIKPIDKELIEWTMGNIPLIVTIEEHSIIGGLGSAVAEVMAEDGFGGRLIRLGTCDVFGESAMADELLEKHGLTPSAVAKRVGKEFGR
ncbi:MAG: transketolase C-terminal domain-containing protein [Chloroflexota bacterium]|nr:transketolase C-terminal domain-containing protein [Chloroflexota bacterium]